MCHSLLCDTLGVNLGRLSALPVPVPGESVCILDWVGHDAHNRQGNATLETWRTIKHGCNKHPSGDRPFLRELHRCVRPGRNRAVRKALCSCGAFQSGKILSSRGRHKGMHQPRISMCVRTAHLRIGFPPTPAQTCRNRTHHLCIAAMEVSAHSDLMSAPQ